MTTVTRKDQSGKEWEVDTKYLTDTPDNTQDWKWLDGLYNGSEPLDKFVKEEIRARFTAQEATIQQRLITSIDADIAAQAKLCQAELLKARLDEISQTDSELSDTTHNGLSTSSYMIIVRHLAPRLERLRALIARLEGEADKYLTKKG